MKYKRLPKLHHRFLRIFVYDRLLIHGLLRHGPANRKYTKVRCILWTFTCSIISKLSTWTSIANSAKDLMSSRRTLHLGSSMTAFKFWWSELTVSFPKISMNLVAAWIPPFLTYWLSSFINYFTNGWTVWYDWSFEIEASMFFNIPPT